MNKQEFTTALILKLAGTPWELSSITKEAKRAADEVFGVDSNNQCSRGEPIPKDGE